MITKPELAKQFQGIAPCGMLGRVVAKMIQPRRQTHNPLWAQKIAYHFRNRRVARCRVA